MHYRLSIIDSTIIDFAFFILGRGQLFMCSSACMFEYINIRLCCSNNPSSTVEFMVVEKLPLSGIFVGEDYRYWMWNTTMKT